MMVKSGLETIILKFHKPFKVAAAQCEKNLPSKAEFAWQVGMYLWKGSWNFKIFFSRPLFIIILKMKVSISRLEILVQLLKEF